MAILEVRDADGNVQEILAIKGEDGKDYVLTEADKQEIADLVSGGGNVDLSDYYTKAETEHYVYMTVYTHLDDNEYVKASWVREYVASQMPPNGDSEDY